MARIKGTMEQIDKRLNHIETEISEGGGQHLKGGGQQQLQVDLRASDSDVGEHHRHHLVQSLGLNLQRIAAEWGRDRCGHLAGISGKR